VFIRPKAAAVVIVGVLVATAVVVAVHRMVGLDRTYGRGHRLCSDCVCAELAIPVTVVVAVVSTVIIAVNVVADVVIILMGVVGSGGAPNGISWPTSPDREE
jgi:hypothetical protein